ncbi:MAG: hypothetical protein JW861_07365 [Bacteroidales bacterium]|nr:hypothetical protein [Bacteroidales bacterium]
MIRHTWTCSLLLLFCFPIPAQNIHISDLDGDESMLYAQTKQVNQFFRRFNGEENQHGERYHTGDSLYRDIQLRLGYLPMLFDQQNPNIEKDDIKNFIAKLTDPVQTAFLDFHGQDWFAELPATFLTYRKRENLILFLCLEQERLGYKWSITNVYYERFLKLYYKGEAEMVMKTFLHPMSHELDFMNIRKVFQNPDYVEYYACKSFHPDFISLLTYEVKQGNMKFEGSGDPKFHFFQIPGWYFEVSFVNRPGYNTGWLITKLIRITEEERRELINFYQP